EGRQDRIGRRSRFEPHPSWGPFIVRRDLLLEVAGIDVVYLDYCKSSVKGGPIPVRQKQNVQLRKISCEALSRLEGRHYPTVILLKQLLSSPELLVVAHKVIGDPGSD
ncbi:MAG TPA: hypothetical protein VK171_02890, partial [Fimbriimonas sp.]|nr:hypothetical protein [Fimbriimonas sp.]